MPQFHPLAGPDNPTTMGGLGKDKNRHNGNVANLEVSLHDIAGALPPSEPTSSLPDKSPHRTPYRLGSTSSEEDAKPLLLRMLHRPRRADSELVKASDPTRKNSLINASSWSDTGSGQPPAGKAGKAVNLANLASLQNLGGPWQQLLPSASSPPSSVDFHPQDDDHGHANDDDTESPRQPYRLVRKKSGEIVKPSLKDSCLIKARLLSLPLTPTYKLVHFGDGEDVRYFKQKDRPAAISAQNSPDFDAVEDGYFSEDDSMDYHGLYLSHGMRSLANMDYIDDELNSHVSKAAGGSGASGGAGASRVEWLLDIVDFPPLSYQERILLRQQPVFLERIFLSVDQRYLLGQVAVRNIEFEKLVVVRYTQDEWNTVVEIPTIFVPDAPKILKSNHYDRFVFKIVLDDLVDQFVVAHHTQSTQDSSSVLRLFQLCVRYRTAGREFWDNNDSRNYSIRLERTDKSFRPRLSHNQNMPSAAKSKPQAHIKKPKYSSNYLKRIHSEPSLLSAAATAAAADSPAVHPETNDFEVNDFYMLSPLLSSLRSKNDPTYATRTTAAAEREPLPSPVPDIGSYSDVTSEEVSPDEEDTLPAVGALSPPRRNPLDSMTYKELLDSYCFFSAPAGNNSTATFVLSDEPVATFNNNRAERGPVDKLGERKELADSAYTISSMLRN